MNPAGCAFRKQLGATAVLLCSLVGRSCGYAAVPGVLAVPNTPTTHSRLSGWSGRSNGNGGQFAPRSGSAGGSALLGAGGPRGRSFETVATLRGGAMSFPGLDAAKAAIAAISIPAIAWTGGPALFAQVGESERAPTYVAGRETLLPTLGVDVPP